MLTVLVPSHSPPPSGPRSQATGEPQKGWGVGFDTEKLMGFSGGGGTREQMGVEGKDRDPQDWARLAHGSLARCTGAVSSKRPVRAKERHPPAGGLCPGGACPPATTHLQAGPERFLQICSG